MPKKLSRPGSQKKKMEPTIVVALIALTGTLVTGLLNSSLLLEWLKHRPQSEETAPSSSPFPSNPAAPDSASTSSEGDQTCLVDYFADVDASKQISIEVGVTAQDVEFPSRDLDTQGPVGPFGIRLTQNGRTIGALHFLFFAESELFKLTSVVDADCQLLADYSNVHGGDQNAIENSGWLNLPLQEGTFTLNFQRWGVNKFRFNFQQAK